MTEAHENNQLNFGGPNQGRKTTGFNQIIISVKSEPSLLL